MIGGVAEVEVQDSGDGGISCIHVGRICSLASSGLLEPWTFFEYPFFQPLLRSLVGRHLS